MRVVGSGGRFGVVESLFFECGSQLLQTGEVVSSFL